VTVSVSYPLTPPATPGFRRFAERLALAQAVSVSPYTLSQQAASYGGARWEFDLELPPMPRSLAAAWLAFLDDLEGVFGTFELTPPTEGTPRGTPAGTPLVKGASQTGRELLTDGWTPSASGVLKKGDWVQIGTQLLRVSADVSADGSGEATVRFMPRLRSSPADNAPLVTSNPKGRFRLAEPVTARDVDMAKIHGISFRAVEAF
jgi:hypothetical protein